MSSAGEPSPDETQVPDSAVHSREMRALVEQCLALMEESGPDAVAKVCEQHPEHADAIRQRIASLARFGMVPGMEPGGEESIPERLGEFLLLRRLGGGGMGLVYLAEQETLGRRVALKLVRPDQLWFSNVRERFRREVETVARLQHPGIVPIYSVGEESGVPFFAMEYAVGRSLAQVILHFHGRSAQELTGADLEGYLRKKRGDEDCTSSSASGEGSGSGTRTTLFDGGWVEVCLRMVRLMAEALEHAHQNGVLHRDVKSSNIMVTAEGRVLLIDFGLARRQGATPMTRSSSDLGSLPYMSPEQVKGDFRSATARSDIYSLGVVLYELLTLQPPHRGTTNEETRRSILLGNPRSVRSSNAQVSRDVETVCLAAMDLEPEGRYASAGDLARDLEHVLSLRPIEARRTVMRTRTRRFVQRHPAACLSAFLAFLLLTLTPLLLWNQERRVSQDLAAANQAAQTAQGELETVLEDVIRLSDLKQVRDLEREAADLWPLHPERRASLEAWLERAAALTQGLPGHRASLVQLEQAIAGAPGNAALRSRFDREDLEWWRATLSTLVTEMETLLDPDPSRGRVADVQLRLQRVTSLRELSLGEHEERWEDVLDEIFLEEFYAGLELEPQLGLVPLGPDPDSGLQEFWHVLSGARPERDDEEHLQSDGSTGIVLILIPPDSVWLGTQKEDPARPNYDPAANAVVETLQQVELEAFFVSKFELTQGQWARMMGTWPAYFGPEFFAGQNEASRHPVEEVSWDEAVTALFRQGLTLPTEAQWEYSARGGVETPWWTGRVPESLAGKVNLADQEFTRFYSFPLAWEEWEDGHGPHAPVGSFPANAFGLHGVLGNVGEWCQDYFVKEGYSARNGDGLFVPGDDVVTTRSIRGGAYKSIARDCRVSHRNHLTPSDRSDALGLRPARRVDGPTASDR